MNAHFSSLVVGFGLVLSALAAPAAQAFEIRLPDLNLNQQRELRFDFQCDGEPVSLFISADRDKQRKLLTKFAGDVNLLVSAPIVKAVCLNEDTGVLFNAKTGETTKWFPDGTEETTQEQPLLR